MRVKNINQACAGVFLVLVSVLALYLTWPLSSGTEVGLGPGYVPKLLSWVLIGFGLLMLVDSVRNDGEPAEAWEWRPLVLVLASVGYFAVTIERLGLALALAGLILISCGASRESRLLSSIILVIGTVVFSVLVFVKALGLSLVVGPPFI